MPSPNVVLQLDLLLQWELMLGQSLLVSKLTCALSHLLRGLLDDSFTNLMSLFELRCYYLLGLPSLIEFLLSRRPNSKE